MKQQIISVFNNKGGVGKTTISETLAYLFARQGNRVLLIDCDPQASSSVLCGKIKEVKDLTMRSMKEAFYEGGGLNPLKVKIDNQDIFQIEGFPKTSFDICISRPSMAFLDQYMAGAIQREYILQSLILTEATNYDIIIIDCPPYAGYLAINALAASTELIIPVTPDVLAVEGLNTMVDFFGFISRKLNNQLRLLGIAITQTERNGTSSVCEAEIRNALPDIVFATSIRRSADVKNAQRARINVLKHKPKGGVAHDFRALFDEIKNKMQ